MTWTAEQNEIAARFAAQSPVSASLVAWDDMNGPAFTPPTVDTTSATTAAQSIWLRLTVQPVPMSGEPLALGATSKHTRRGLIVVQCFAPAGYGEAALSTVVDSVRWIFHRAVLGTVRCRDTDAPHRIGLRDQWWQVNVLTPYWVEEAGTA